MSVGYSRSMSVSPSRSAATRAASNCCSSASTPSFSSPGSSPSSMLVSDTTSCSSMRSDSPFGVRASMTPSDSTIVQGGFIQLSGLNALLSEWIASDPSALNMISRVAGASRAPSRPWYSTEHCAMRRRIGVRVLQVGAPVASLSMRSPVDRRIAAVVLVLGVVSILLPTLIARGATNGDETAAADLVALARRQERGSWLVDFRFSRSLHSGGNLDQKVTEANHPPTHVTASASTVTVDFGDKVASCTETADGPRCI